MLVLALCGSIAIGLAAQTSSEVHGIVSDPQGRPISGATVVITADDTGFDATLTTDDDGTYRAPGLPPGRYTVTVSHEGFATSAGHLDLPLNRQVTLDMGLTLGARREQVTVRATPLLVETGSSSTGDTVAPAEVESMPLLDRSYLGLLQLVPGVAINRAGSGDAAAPVLGERANNTYFLIDGMPNRDEIDGGDAVPFSLDAILEMQVLTSGYRAEFGRGSGGVVNAATKSGTNAWRGSTSLFHRDSALDSADVPDSAVPFLRRWNASATIGGPLVKDRMFLFGAAERIRETRQSNFQYPADFPPALRRVEASIDRPEEVYESRGFGKIDEVLGHHRFTEEISLTNAHLADEGGQPSTRTNTTRRRLMLGARETSMWGDLGSPYLFGAYVQYRDEPTATRPAHLDFGMPSTFVNLFSGLKTGELFGDVTQETIGPGFSARRLTEQSASCRGESHAAMVCSRREIRLGRSVHSGEGDGRHPDF